MISEDRKEEVWKDWYRKIYTEKSWEFWKLIDFESIDKKGVARFKKLSEEMVNKIKNKKIREYYENYRDSFLISGDTDFNLMGTHLEEEVHKKTNFSLMPVNGGMNCKKGFKNTCNDIFPLFISRLSSFWTIEDEDERKDHFDTYLCNRPTKYKTSAQILKDFLGLFDKIDDYCKKMYHIDDKLTEKLVKYGKEIEMEIQSKEKRICTWQNETEYLNWAEKYFKSRNKA